ncbi:MAG: transcriptional repressor [Desulfuromonadales bacterium]|nr:transcriptional repressor [Desulfuromonadales bacterium]
MQRRTHKTGDNNRSELESICKKHGLALTIQRRAILETLVSRTDHPTADQVYEAVSARMKGVSRTTVYRVLDTFVSIGIAKKVSNPQSKARFDAEMNRHHHLTCLRCGLVLDMFDANLSDLQLPSGIEDEFRILDYSVTFTGLCASCNEATCGRPDRSIT